MNYTGKIEKLIHLLKSFDAIKALKQSISSAENVITEAISEEQLFKKGINGDNVSIMSYKPYAPRTIKNKIRKGQPYNRVTLRDSGNFHRSFYLVCKEDSFYVDAMDPKTEELLKKYGNSVLKITPENFKEIMQRYIKPVFIANFKNLILHG